MDKTQKPLILVSNDDGITSKGIRHLVTWMKELGEVIVVAPDRPQSGMGHAITIHEPLKYHRTEIFEQVEAYECSGTPADCIKLAKNHLLKNRRSPDLVVSGINHGSNASVSVLYSGTMSAAIEAALEGLPAIGFSLCDYDFDAYFDHCYEHVIDIAWKTLTHGIPSGISLNVNFPKYNGEKIRGMKICRQARAKWQENFDERKDPYGRRYLWLTGEFINYDHGEDTDIWAIKQYYTSIVPTTFDMTAHHLLAEMNNKWTVS